MSGLKRTGRLCSVLLVFSLLFCFPLTVSADAHQDEELKTIFLRVLSLSTQLQTRSEKYEGWFKELDKTFLTLEERSEKWLKILDRSETGLGKVMNKIENLDSQFEPLEMKLDKTQTFIENSIASQNEALNSLKPDLKKMIRNTVIIGGLCIVGGVVVGILAYTGVKRMLE